MSKELTDVELQARDILNEISKEAMRRSGGSDTLYHRNYLDGIDNKIFEINERTPLTELLEKAYNEENSCNKNNQEEDHGVDDGYCMHGFPPNCCPSGCDDIDYDEEDGEEDDDLNEDLSNGYSETEYQEEIDRAERMGASHLKNIGPVVNGFYRLDNMKTLHKNFIEGNFAPIPVFSEKSSSNEKTANIPFNEMFDISYLFCGRTSSESEQLTPDDFNPRVENISVEPFHQNNFLLIDFTVTPVFTIKDSIAESLKIPKGIKILPAISDAIGIDSNYTESMQLVIGDIDAKEKLIKTLKHSLLVSDKISQTPYSNKFNFTIFETNIDEINWLSQEIKNGCGFYFESTTPAYQFINSAKKQCLSINQQIIEAAKTELPEQEKEIDIQVSLKRQFANVFLFDDFHCVDCVNTMMKDNRNHVNHDGKRIFKEPFSGAGAHILYLTTFTSANKNKSKNRSCDENLGL